MYTHTELTDRLDSALGLLYGVRATFVIPCRPYPRELTLLRLDSRIQRACELIESVLADLTRSSGASGVELEKAEIP